MTHLPALVTLLTVLLLFGTMWAVGRARSKYNIKAPAISGDAAFERAYRVQMNTLESTVMFLPTLSLAARYAFSGWAGVAGLVWARRARVVCAGLSAGGMRASVVPASQSA